MPPKKAPVQEKKVLLGRPSNNLKVGIVGLPNVGKSSFFNALSKTDLGKAANFPYATINPEEARIPVPDDRFLWLCNLYKPVSQVPAFLTCIDIAGLTAGASTGAGLGNSFLSHATVEKIHKCLTVDNKDVRKGDWTNKEIEIVNTLTLLTAKPITYLVNLSEKDYVRKKNKWLPKIKAWIDANNPGDPLIPFSVALEERLAPLSEEEQKEAEKEAGATSALGKITQAGYASLDLIRYFTCGPDEVRAWTIRRGTKAPQAAGVIHSDFENKFVCGEIMTFEDLKEYGSESAVKAAGKLRQQGKPYEMIDGDIAYWKSG
ncbi:hypothetical protein FRC06_006446 [Ceratobasidium sp. 370]|nr:hypothetical protein FRC06_006446 [Ceratobasidium sp. 370]